MNPNVSFAIRAARRGSRTARSGPGIKLHKLDPTTGLLATDDTTQYSIAERPNEGAIARPHPSSRTTATFYLFYVSFDKCCDGVNSTYRTMAGRSQGSITGPYADSTGLAMLKGGGDQLICHQRVNISGQAGAPRDEGRRYLPLRVSLL